MTTNTTEQETPLDVLFEMLSHPTRRRILSTIANRNPRDQDEFETEAFAPDNDDELEQFIQKLTHIHLPKLADAGFIDWDRETNTITRGPRFQDIQPLIAMMENHQDELPNGWL